MTERSALPDSLGVMLLRGCVALPHCLVPLYIFEDRYRPDPNPVSSGWCIVRKMGEE